ncbi:MAG: hypothetical protein ACI8TX_001744 [Hyphomicrobiaceae bacterium]|jgi:hypothetical protein
MSMAFGLTLGLIAWITFIYVQYNYGDRPTSRLWFASMMGLGMFEYGKGLFGLIELGLPAFPLAFGAAVSGAVLVYVAQGMSEQANNEEGFIETVVGLGEGQIAAADNG